MNVTISSYLLPIFSIVPQCWKTSQESMSGLFTDQAKVAKYEQQWHSIIFLPCLKKLRVEVSVYICSFYGNEGFCQGYPGYMFGITCTWRVVW